MSAGTMLVGYRGTKVHAVDPIEPRNSTIASTGEGMSRCGWRVTVGDEVFTPQQFLTCGTCTKAVAR